MEVVPIDYQEQQQPQSGIGDNDINERMQFLNTQIKELIKLRKEIIIRLILIKIELLLLLLAFYLMIESCYETQLKELFIIGIIINIIQISKYYYLLLIIYFDLQEINQNGINNRVPYPEYSYQTLKDIIDAITDYHICYKLFRYITLILEITQFIVIQILIYNNLHNQQCEIGQEDTNFTWGIALMFLILKYINTGIPLFLYQIYIMLKCCLFCCQLRTNYRYNNQFNNNGLQQIEIDKLQIQVVNDQKLNDENECIICLQEFIKGEQYIQLKCHEQHIFHRNCILDWFKQRKDCPKCRQIVKF